MGPYTLIEDPTPTLLYNTPFGPIFTLGKDVGVGGPNIMLHV